MIDIVGVLARLAPRRPIFHSEADFQHALAWQIQREHPASAVRLETRPERGIHLDILVDERGYRTALELKYLTDRFAGRINGEQFDMPRQAAHDIARYDACKDLWRLEKCLVDGYANVGLAVVLSNERGYWRPGKKSAPIDTMFRLHEGRTIMGTLEWATNAGPGTTRGRLAPLPLQGRYECRWRPYAMVSQADGREVEFRYLVHQIDSDLSPSRTWATAE
jgi:hypothetical protein